MKCKLTRKLLEGLNFSGSCPCGCGKFYEFMNEDKLEVRNLKRKIKRLEMEFIKFRDEAKTDLRELSRSLRVTNCDPIPVN